ncbi:MAG TPA: hypothetical protein VMK12_25680, partial [Anaeromyxobacteraceae bacterium]|nr:hypothetical protein [Anaeromyxobacteraceae bacterium]
FERTGLPSAGSGSLAYYNWFAFEFWRFQFVQKEVAKVAQTAIEFPPMQKGARRAFPCAKRRFPRYPHRARGVDVLQPVEGVPLQGEDVPRGRGALGRGNSPRGEALGQSERSDMVLGVEPECVERGAPSAMQVWTYARWSSPDLGSRNWALLAPARVAYSGSGSAVHSHM